MVGGAVSGSCTTRSFARGWTRTGWPVFLAFEGVDGYADESLLDDLLAEDVLFATALTAGR